MHHPTEVLRVLPEPSLLVTEEARVVRANLAFLRWINASREDVEGHALADLVEDREGLAEQMRRWASSAELVPGSLRLRLGDRVHEARCEGGAVCFEADAERPLVFLRMSPREDAASPVAALERRISDLTSEIARRRDAEAELAAQGEWLRVTLSSIGDGVVATDRAGRVTFLNAAAEHYTGWESSEALGRPLSDLFVLVDEETREPAESPVERALHEGVVVGMNTHTLLVRRDRSELPIADSAAPILDARGRTLGVVLVFQDETMRRFNEVSRRELLERERRARERAEAANRTKDELLATLSHELRTPLHAILGWTRFLREEGVGADETAYGLEVVERNARSQLQMVEELLDVSRIASGRLRLRVEEVDLSDVVHASVATVSLAAQAKPVDLRIEDLGAGAIVTGDPMRLQQALFHVLDNAVKFTPAGRSVTVRVQKQASAVEISVHDEGVGLSDEQMEHLFEPFWQAEAASTRAHGGLGLGLSLVRRVVEAHGGTVHARSAGPEHGSVFVLRLPVRALVDRPVEAAKAECPARMPPAERLDGLRVLVVEDHEDARTLVARVLTKRGAEVRLAESASEGLATLDCWVPDVILSDIAMPGVDGYAFVRAVRARPPERGGAIPAAAFTAFASEDDRRRAESAGFQRHVSKPATPDVLVDVIRDLAGRPVTRH